MRPRFGLFAAGMAATWLAYGVVWAVLLLPRHRGDVFGAVRFNVALVLPLAAGALLVVPLALALERRRPGWRGAWVVHAVAAASFVLADAAALRAVGVVRGVPMVSVWNARGMVRDLLAYALMAAATHAAARSAAARREEERAEALTAALAQRRVDALRWSLRPEVILATLGRVGRLAEDDPERADAEVVRLARTLRLLLSAPDVGAWPLRRELVLLRSLRRLMFPDGRVAVTLPRELRDVPTPRSLLCAAADLWAGGGPIRVDVRSVGATVAARIEGGTPVPDGSVPGLDDHLRGLAAAGRAVAVRGDAGAVLVEWARPRDAPA